MFWRPHVSHLDLARAARVSAVVRNQRVHHDAFFPPHRSVNLVCRRLERVREATRALLGAPLRDFGLGEHALALLLLDESVGSGPAHADLSRHFVRLIVDELALEGHPKVTRDGLARTRTLVWNEADVVAARFVAHTRAIVFYHHLVQVVAVGEDL